MSMKHDFYPREDDLSHCKVCGGAEGSLPTLCPGRRLTEEEETAIYAGQLDFNHGPMSGGGWWIPHPTKKEPK
jgi:hypothetical protein